MMLKLALLFAFLLFPLILGNSYALPFDELNSFDDSQNQIIFNSNIVDIDSNFFIENNFKRYLIFGSNSLPDIIYTIIPCMELNLIMDFFLYLYFLQNLHPVLFLKDICN